MRETWLCLLLVLLAAPAARADDKTVRDEANNFEIAPPPGAVDDWDRLTPAGDRKDIKAHFKTEFADTEPRAVGEVQVIVVPLTGTYASKGLDYLASNWAPSMEGAVQNPRELKEGKTTLGGEEAYFRDVQGDYGPGVAHITWYVTRMGKNIYVVHIIRTFSAIGNRELEDELGQIRDSFKFLKKEAVKADPKAKNKGGPAGPGGAGGVGAGEVGPDPALLEREKITLEHWRIEMVKPEGLLKVDPESFDETEVKNHVVAKFERTIEQTRIMIRVYAQIEKAQVYTIEQLADTYVKYFNQTYKEGSRLEPEIDSDYKKFPSAKKAIMMKLVGRRTVPEATYWYLAQCKNDRQYQIQVYITGATGEKQWENQIKDFLKSFKPLKD